MESEKTKAGDLFPATTTSLSKLSDPAPASRHHEVTDFLTMSNVSAEEEAEEKEEVFPSQDTALLFVVEEQVWSRLSNPLERETSAGLESSQGDPEALRELSKGESNFSAQETSSQGPSLDFYQGGCTAAYSSRGLQSSLSGITPLEQDPFPPSKFNVEQLQDHAIPLGFPQALNFCDTFLQTKYEETMRTDSFPMQEESICRCPLVNHGIAKCHQNAESSKSSSNEEQSWEQEAQKGLAQKMKATRGSDDEMSSKAARDGGGQPIISSGDEEKVIELTGEKNDFKSYASPKCSELSNGSGINSDATQAMPNILSPSPSETVNNHSDTKNLEDLEKKSFISSSLHLWEDEENTGRDHSPPKEEIQTKHVKNNTDCSESKSTQENLKKPEPVKMEALELEDMEAEKEEDNLNWKEMENAMKMEQERLELDQEDPEWDVEVQNISREELQEETPVHSFRPGLETLYTLENDSVLSEFNKNHSLVESEELTFRLMELFPQDGCPESAFILPEPHSQSTKANTVLVSQSPKTQPDNGEWKHSGGCDHTDCEQSTKRGNYESKEDARDGGSMRALGGEGITLLVDDLAVTPDPYDVHDSQFVDHPVDDEGCILTSPPGTMSMQGDAGKGAKDSTVDYAMVEEESDSIQEPLDAAVCKKASVLSSEFRDIQAHHKKTISSMDFHEETDSSVPKNLQKTLPDKGLLSTDKDSVELNLVSSLTPQNPESLQTQDADGNYLEKFQQHLKPPVRSFVFPGKEAGDETLNTVQETTLYEPSCLVVLEEDKTECEHRSETAASPIDTATHLTEFPQPLSLVPFPDQTETHESVSGQFHQSSSPTQDCKQPAWCGTPPPNANSHAQPTDPELDPKHPTQTLEQLPSPNQTGQFFTIQPTSVEFPTFSAPITDTEASVLPLASDPGPSHLPEQVFTFDCSPSLEYVAEHPMPMPNLLPQTGLSVCPTPNANLSLQPFLADSSQMREATAPELNTSLLLPQLPDFDFNMDLHHLPPASVSNLPPTTDENKSAQQSVEPSLAINCLADAKMPKNLPTINLVSQTTQSVLEAKNLAQISNAHGSTEEPTLVPLTKLEDKQALQGQGNTLSDSGASLLVTCSNLAILRNDPSALDPSCTPEPTANIMDKSEGKSSSDHSFQPSLESQEMHEAVEGRTAKQIPPMLAFTNPIHFLQFGPPSPPTARHSRRQQAFSQGPQWQQVAMVDSAIMRQMAEGTGRLWKGSEKPEAEPIPPVPPRKERKAKHPLLEKSISCPNRSVIQLDTKDPEHNSKTQEVLTKIRTKSKDWHRQGLRKISIPTENALAEAIASLVPSREEALAHKDPPDHLDRALHGEKKSPETVENIKRRHSKLINSSRLLYQEYSDVALNKAIQNQKRADSLSEELELVSPGSRNSPKLRRKAPHSQDSCLQRLSVSSSASLWQDIPMVRGSTMLLSMTREEQKLQEAKFELIASEASYLRSLNVAVDHFQRSQELQAVLTNQDKQWLFSRLPDVRDVSANFLFDLEEKLEENMFTFNVCDVALKHAPEFRRVYLPYVTNQTYQEQTFRRLLNDVPPFQQVLEKLESDPICQRLSLKSFLILPFQRITRLKLLLQNILKRTRPGADEEIQATQAYDALEKLIKDCNENVQRMKNTEELIYLSQNMVFECKIFPLISQSRRLVKRGELTQLEYNLSLKWKLTTRPIYLHLFNDFLLLSRPRENGHFIVFDYAASSEVRGEKCEMKLHGANKNVFRLFLLQNNQGKKVEFLFRTETQSEKLRWISALSPQQAELDLLDDPDAPQVQCVKSCKARENDELALEKADIVMVLRQSTDGWIEGVKLSDGERGWFPSEQVEFISSKHVRQMNLKEEQRVKNAKQQVFRRK
ncbi:rho guanine nucleotide exchange factor 5 isoform X2 [Heteronotia binoei]|nr:rho guanine nucleotide exchange factor 5 isoform X2 [Heteronotia binoei]